MKLTHYIYIGAALVMLSACGDDIEETPVYTVGEADNAIVLRAGVSEGYSGAQTRAGADDNHAKHVGFTTGTAVALRIDGTWTGHSPEYVKKKTVATLKAASYKHNEFDTYNPVIYWDDFGTADPANKDTGRAQGLTIYGAAVDGKTTLPTTLSSDLDNTPANWKALSWNVGTSTSGVVDQSTTAGWGDYDLLVSNNVVYSTTVSDDNAYKFADRANGKLLEFTHAMTKITVELTAGEGFAGYRSQDRTAAKFGTTAPTATLKGFYYTGKVDVETKTSTATAANGSASPVATTDIKMKLISGGASQNTAKFDALVFPGNLFDNDADILTFTADGNTFIVTAGKLNAAIQSAIVAKATTNYPGTDNTLLQAWNYTIKILVKKTDIVVTATIKGWDEVSTQEETPLIRIIDSYGQEGTSFGKSYDFFRSTVKAKGYDENTSTADVINYAARYTVSTDPASASWDKTLYWPNHQTHYFFRGVYPVTGTVATGTGTIPALPDEAVTTVSGNDVIAVKNAAYSADTYPSDLAIAMPRGATAGTYDETCKVAEHKPGSTAPEGICATEGTIRMNFEYAMSKVQVSLKSDTEGADKVELTNVKVEIIGGYYAGRIKLSDGLHDTFKDADKGSYTLHSTTAETGFSVTTLDAIVPQPLSNDVKIRITVTNSDSTTDVYEAQLNTIADSSTNVITVWEHGKYYKYQLDLKKTSVKVTATITDWATVNASGNIWF